MSEPCQHQKVYSRFLLMSHPPIVRWICRKCQAQGTERLAPAQVYHEEEYQRLLRQKRKSGE